MSAVTARLRQSPYRALRQLSCEMNDDSLVLYGSVSSFHEKQQAQEAIRGIEGMPRVFNEVTVDAERSKQ